MISTWIEAKVLLWLINPTWPIPLQPLPFHKPYHFTKFLISFPLLPLAPSLFCSNHSGVQVVPQAFHAHSSSWLLSLSVPRWGILSLGYSHWFLPLFFFFFQVQVYGVFSECSIEKSLLVAPSPHHPTPYFLSCFIFLHTTNDCETHYIFICLGYHRPTSAHIRE